LLDAGFADWRQDLQNRALQNSPVFPAQIEHRDEAKTGRKHSGAPMILERVFHPFSPENSAHG
jgi:hypothetical protein